MCDGVGGRRRRRVLFRGPRFLWDITHPLKINQDKYLLVGCCSARSTSHCYNADVFLHVITRVWASIDFGNTQGKSRVWMEEKERVALLFPPRVGSAKRKKVNNVETWALRRQHTPQGLSITDARLRIVRGRATAAIKPVGSHHFSHYLLVKCVKWEGCSGLACGRETISCMESRQVKHPFFFKCVCFKRLVLCSIRQWRNSFCR